MPEGMIPARRPFWRGLSETRLVRTQAFDGAQRYGEACGKEVSGMELRRTHIVANRAWWFHARMGEGSADLTSLELWALGVCEADVDPCHPAAELVAGLEKTWQMIEE